MRRPTTSARKWDKLTALSVCSTGVGTNELQLSCMWTECYVLNDSPANPVATAGTTVREKDVQSPHLYPVRDLVPIEWAVGPEARKVRVRVHVNREQDLDVRGACVSLRRARSLQRLQPSALAMFALQLTHIMVSNALKTKGPLAVAHGF